MLSLFLTQSAAGALLVLLMVPPREAGRAFFRFTVGTCAVLVIAGSALSWGDPGAGRGPFLFAAAALALAGSAGLYHLGRIGPARIAMTAALAVCLAGSVLDALRIIPAADTTALSRALYPIDAITSGLVPGSALVAMILGHYYLNVPGLSIRHLQRLSLAFLASVALRAGVVAFSVTRSREALAPLVGLLLDPSAAPPEGALDPFVLVLLLLHLLFGAVAAGAMAFMAWRTALISSTQSATGILYVALLMAITGEMASRYLVTMTRLPL